jgi:hypothetical protein
LVVYVQKEVELVLKLGVFDLADVSDTSGVDAV